MDFRSRVFSRGFVLLGYGPNNVSLFVFCAKAKGKNLINKRSILGFNIQTPDFFDVGRKVLLVGFFWGF